MKLFERIRNALFSSKGGASKDGDFSARRVLRLEALEDRRLLAVDVLAAASESDLSDSALTADESTDAASEIEWNLEEYDYTEYQVDAETSDGGLQAKLYGVDGETRTLLATADATSETTIALVGDDAKVETITISGAALSSVGEIDFDGGSKSNDALVLEGNSSNDVFVVGAETVATDSANATDDFGADGRGWRNRDSWRRRETTEEQAVVSYSSDEAEGAVVRAKNVATLTVDGAGGADSFQIEKTAFDTILVADGDDSLDFSNAETSGRGDRRGGDRWFDDGWFGDDWRDCGWGGGWSGGWGGGWGGGRSGKIDGVSIDFDSSDWQTVSRSWGGRIRLDGDFVSVVGSEKSDRIVGSDISVTEESGANVVVLTDGDNSVEAASDRNYISVSGSGTNAITTTGNRSTIDLTKSDSDATTVVSVEGNGNVVRGGAADDQITLSGERNRANAGSGDDKIVVSGSNNRVSGGDGNDLVWAVASTGRNEISGGSGNDILVGGSGNDRIFGDDGRDVLLGSTGADSLRGGSGTDLLIANRTDATSEMENWDEETRDAFVADLYRTWVEDEDLDATLELIGSECLADGSVDRLWGGRGGDDYFLSSSADGDREFNWDDRWDW